jgi:cobaltochelatase CobN
MMEHGYAGAKNMEEFVETIWDWDIEVPDLITENTWNQIYETYILDKNNLGLKEYFNTNSPYAKQAILARMSEAIRKGSWNPSQDVKTALANEYIESVIKYGVTCCHHTCANLDLSEFMVMGSSLSRAQLQQFADAFEGATGQTLKIPGNPGGQNDNPDQGKVPPSEENTEDNGQSTNPDQGTTSPGEASTVQAASTEAGEASDSGSENAHEISQVNEQSSSQSNTPLIAIIGVILLLCLVGVGYFRNDIRNLIKK